VDFLIIGNGMFGAAIARHLAPHAQVMVVGPEAPADGRGAYGAHHDEGRIIGDLGRDVIWSELNQRARRGMTELDPTLITPCGALTAKPRGGPDALSLAARIGDQQNVEAEALTADAAGARFPMVCFGPDETIIYQPAAGYFSPRRYVALAMQSARDDGATITPGTVRALRTSAAGAEAELDDGRRVRAGAAIVASGAFAAGSDLLPVPVALRAKSEVCVMPELDDQQAADLHAMPCVSRAIDHPQLADLYVLPPIRYPDGRAYLKFGASTLP